MSARIIRYVFHHFIAVSLLFAVWIRPGVLSLVYFALYLTHLYITHFNFLAEHHAQIASLPNIHFIVCLFAGLLLVYNTVVQLVVAFTTALIADWTSLLGLSKISTFVEFIYIYLCDLVVFAVSFSAIQIKKRTAPGEPMRLPPITLYNAMSVVLFAIITFLNISLLNLPFFVLLLGVLTHYAVQPHAYLCLPSMTSKPVVICTLIYALVASVLILVQQFIGDAFLEYLGIIVYPYLGSEGFSYNSEEISGLAVVVLPALLIPIAIRLFAFPHLQDATLLQENSIPLSPINERSGQEAPRHKTLVEHLRPWSTVTLVVSLLVYSVAVQSCLSLCVLLFVMLPYTLYKRVRLPYAHRKYILSFSAVIPAVYTICLVYLLTAYFLVLFSSESHVLLPQFAGIDTTVQLMLLFPPVLLCAAYIYISPTWKLSGKKPNYVRNVTSADLLTAVINNDHETVNGIIRYSPQLFTSAEAFDEQRRSVLHLAVVHGHAWLLYKLVMWRGLHTDYLNSRDSNGNTPLHLAKNSDSKLCVCVLLFVCADWRLTNYKDESNEEMYLWSQRSWLYILWRSVAILSDFVLAHMEKLVLGFIYVAAVDQIDVLHFIYFLFFLSFLSIPPITANLWIILLAYSEIVLVITYTFDCFVWITDVEAPNWAIAIGFYQPRGLLVLWALFVLCQFQFVLYNIRFHIKSDGQRTEELRSSLNFAENEYPSDSPSLLRSIINFFHLVFQTEWMLLPFVYILILVTALKQPFAVLRLVLLVPLIVCLWLHAFSPLSITLVKWFWWIVVLFSSLALLTQFAAQFLLVFLHLVSQTGVIPAWVTELFNRHIFFFTPSTTSQHGLWDDMLLPTAVFISTVLQLRLFRNRGGDEGQIIWRTFPTGLQWVVLSYFQVSHLLTIVAVGAVCFVDFGIPPNVIRWVYIAIILGMTPFTRALVFLWFPTALLSTIIVLLQYAYQFNLIQELVSRVAFLTPDILSLIGFYKGSTMINMNMIILLTCIIQRMCQAFVVPLEAIRSEKYIEELGSEDIDNLDNGLIQKLYDFLVAAAVFFIEVVCLISLNVLDHWIVFTILIFSFSHMTIVSLIVVVFVTPFYVYTGPPHGTNGLRVIRFSIMIIYGLAVLFTYTGLLAPSLPVSPELSDYLLLSGYSPTQILYYFVPYIMTTISKRNRMFSHIDPYPPVTESVLGKLVKTEWFLWFRFNFNYYLAPVTLITIFLLSLTQSSSILNFFLITMCIWYFSLTILSVKHNWRIIRSFNVFTLAVAAILAVPWVSSSVTRLMEAMGLYVDSSDLTVLDVPETTVSVFIFILLNMQSLLFSGEIFNDIEFFVIQSLLDRYIRFAESFRHYIYKKHSEKSDQQEIEVFLRRLDNVFSDNYMKSVGMPPLIDEELWPTSRPQPLRCLPMNKKIRELKTASVFINTEKKITNCNSPMQTLSGLSLRRMKHKTPYFLVDEKDHKSLDRLVNACLKNWDPTPFTFLTKLLIKGSTIDVMNVSVSGISRINERRELIGAVLMFTEKVIELKGAEQTMDEEDYENDKLISGESFGDPCFSVDKDMRIDEYNEYMQALTLFPSPLVVDKLFEDEDVPRKLRDVFRWSSEEEYEAMKDSVLFLINSEDVNHVFVNAEVILNRRAIKTPNCCVVGSSIEEGDIGLESEEARRVTVSVKVELVSRVHNDGSITGAVLIVRPKHTSETLKYWMRWGILCIRQALLSNIDRSMYLKSRVCGQNMQARLPYLTSSYYILKEEEEEALFQFHRRVSTLNKLKTEHVPLILHPKAAQNDHYGIREEFTDSVVWWWRIAMSYLASNTQSVVFLILIIDLIISANFLSMLLPMGIFMFALIEDPRAPKSFWVFAEGYLQCLIGIRYLYQLGLFCNGAATGEYFLAPVIDCQLPVPDSADLSVRYDYLLGLYKISGSKIKFFLPQFLALVVIAIHRMAMQSKGVYDMSEAQYENSPLNVYARHYFGGIHPSWSNFQICKYFYSVIPRNAREGPEYRVKPGKNWYFYYSTAQIAMIIYVMLFWPAMTSSGIDAFNALSNNYFSGNMVLFTTFQIVISTLDRVSYLYKSLKMKLGLQYFTVISVHILIFFVFPLGSQKGFASTPALVVFYLLYCQYWWFSALQIRDGFCSIQRYYHSVMKRAGHIRRFLNNIYRAIPLLFEIQILLDWMSVPSTLDLWETLRLEDIYFRMYNVKVDLLYKRSRDRATLQPTFRKFFSGTLIFVLLVGLLIAPMLIFSTANPAFQGAQVLTAALSMKIQTPTGIFSLFSISSVAQIKDITDEEYDLLDSLGIVQDVEAESAQRISMASASDSVWGVSPSSLQILVSDLSSLENVGRVFKIIEFTFRKNGPPDSPESSGSQISVMQNTVCRSS